MNDKSFTKDSILELIYIAIEKYNELNPDNLKLNKSLETVIFGSKGNLDSLGLITFLVEVENLINKNLNSRISIIDEMLFLEENSPYRNIDSLCKYIFEKIKCQ